MTSNLSVDTSQASSLRLPTPETTPSSVHSTPFPSPHPLSNIEPPNRCDACQWATEESVVIRRCPKQHRYCNECEVDEIGCGYCQALGIQPPIFPPEKAIPAALASHQAKYDNRHGKEVLPEPLRLLEQNEQNFTSTYAAYGSNFSNTVKVGHIYIKRRFRRTRSDKWLVTAMCGSPTANTLDHEVEGSGRTLGEALWNLRRSLRLTHYCSLCHCQYDGKPGCVQCATRDVITTRQECGICKEKSGLIYGLKCGHVFCKPCLVRMKQHNPDQQLTCPECRAPVCLSKGWSSQCNGNWCECILMSEE